MTCAKCKQQIEDMTSYQHVPGIGDCHVSCPADPQLSLSGDEDRLPVDDVTEEYPD